MVALGGVHSRGGEAGPPGAPPLPRVVRELAISKAADSTAFDPSGSRPHEARPLRPSGDAGLRAGRPRAAGGQVPQGCVDGLASHLERSVLFPAARGAWWGWLGAGSSAARARVLASRALNSLTKVILDSEYFGKPAQAPGPAIFGYTFVL